MAVLVNVPGFTSHGSVVGPDASNPYTTTDDVAGFGFYSESVSGKNNLGIGVYSESHVSGTGTGHTYGGGYWINLDAGYTGPSGYILSAQDNGIYGDAETALTGVEVVFGLRMEGIVSQSPASFYPFSVNTNNRAVTALFEGASTPSVGYESNTGTTSNKIGDVPLFKSQGTTGYVRIYDARG
jgi:hypothetical protein